MRGYVVLRSGPRRDSGAPIIRTAQSVGYAFCPELEQTPSATGLCHWLMASGRRIALRDGENSIVRDPSSNVWLDSASVSRVHARIVVGHDGVSIEDCRRKNGTRVGEERVTAATGRRSIPVQDRLCALSRVWRRHVDLNARRERRSAAQRRYSST